MSGSDLLLQRCVTASERGNVCCPQPFKYLQYFASWVGGKLLWLLLQSNLLHMYDSNFAWAAERSFSDYTGEWNQRIYRITSQWYNVMDPLRRTISFTPRSLHTSWNGDKSRHFNRETLSNNADTR